MMAAAFDNIPQWKKDLILRKRAQNKTDSNAPTAAQLSSVSATSCTRSEVDSCKIAGTFAPSTRSVPTNDVDGGGSGEVEKQYLQQGEPTVQSEQAAVSFALATDGDGGSERCSEPAAYANNTLVGNAEAQVVNNKMVRDSVLVMQASVAVKTMIANGGGGGGGAAGEESDSSEELQYGPGIVNKLKSKYLSLTLRDTTSKPRPTILNMRRATSLENMLDSDSGCAADDLMAAHHNLNGSGGGTAGETPSGAVKCVSEPLTSNSRRYITRAAQNGDRNGVNLRSTMQNRYRNTMRGNESMKRARSVETLVRPTANEDALIICAADKEGNENSTKRIQHADNTKPTGDDVKPLSSYPNTGQRVNRPKRVTSIMDETERPPADHVKQTLMLFEGPPVHRTRQPRPTGEVANKVATFRHIIEHDKQKSSAAAKKPAVATKPQIATRPLDKLKKTRSPSPKRSETPTPAANSDVPLSPEPVGHSDLIPDVSRVAEVCDVSNLNVNVGRLRLSETPDLIVHSTNAHVHSPKAIRHLTTEFLKHETQKCSEIISKSSRAVVNRSPSPRAHKTSDETVVDTGAEVAKEITKQAVENIAKAGTSVTYSFIDNTNKSHLPRLNTVPVCITRLIPDTPSNKSPIAVVEQHNVSTKSRPEVNGLARATSPQPPAIKEQHKTNATTKVSSSVANDKYVPPPVPKQTARTPPTTTTPTTVAVPLQNKTLTTRELEKNSINKLKTLEQPVSKVVVSVRNVDDVVVLNKNLTGLLNKTSTKPNRTQEQTTILFNFQTRDTIPDYIATDGSSNVRRGKREKPKPGESGIILLPGAPVEEFRTDDEEDWMVSLNGPPSPCDVSFENDNVLIHGRSSISKQPKRQKMHIQFDDRATQLFEYPSEASMLEEVASPAFNTAPAPSGGHPVLMMPGSSLASYTPSKMTVAGDFELGVTRSTQPAPVVTAPALAASSMLSATETGPTIHEPDQPLTYSAETTADILF